MKTINKISDEFIEIVETVERTQVTQFNKNVLIEEKRKAGERIRQIDDLLTNF